MLKNSPTNFPTNFLITFSTPLQQIIPVPIGDGEGEIDKMGKLLEELFEKTYKDNEVVKKIMDAKAYGLWKLPTALIKNSIVLSRRDLKIESEQLYMKNKMYVPEMRPCSYICCSSITILSSMAIQDIK